MSRIIKINLFIILFGAILSIPIHDVFAQSLTPTGNELLLRTGKTWEVKINQKYQLDSSTLFLSFPSPYLLWKDGSSQPIEISNILVKLDGREVGYSLNYFDFPHEILRLNRPELLNEVEITYSVPSDIAQQIYSREVSFSFISPERAKFTWQRAEDGIPILAYGCGVLDFSSLVFDKETCLRFGDLQNQLILISKLPMVPKETFTVALDFAHEATYGNVTEDSTDYFKSIVASANDSKRNSLPFDWFWLLPIVLLIALIYFYNKKQDNKRIKGPVVAEYQPPLDMTPELAGYLLSGKVSRRLVFTWLVRQIFVGSIKLSKDHSGRQQLVVTIDHFPEFDLEREPRILWSLDNLVFNGQGTTKYKYFLSRLSTLEAGNTRYHQYRTLEEAMRQRLEDLGYVYRRNKIWYALVMVLFILGLSVFGNIDNLGFLANPEYFAIAVISIFLLSFTFLQWPVYTKSGRSMRAQLSGFKEYLRVAEHYRYNRKYKPNLDDPEVKKIIPYLIAFDLKTDQFSDLEKFIPSIL